MSHWQFCEDNTDISHSPTAERDATEVRIWEVSGELIIAAEKTNLGWAVSGSDYYPEWTEHTGYYEKSYQQAIHALFSRIDHDHEATESCELRKIKGIEYIVCDLCGKPFTSTEIED